MKRLSILLLIALVLAGCTASRYYRHSQEASPKYRHYYQGKQRKNSRRRPTNSYAEGYFQGKTYWLAQ